MLTTTFLVINPYSAAIFVGVSRHAKVGQVFEMQTPLCTVFLHPMIVIVELVYYYYAYIHTFSVQFCVRGKKEIAYNRSS
jgi:hypothetical protein